MPFFSTDQLLFSSYFQMNSDLFHLRECELGAGAGGVRPTLHHSFCACIKTHAFRAVDMMVAEQAALPSAETAERHRHRQRYVDTDHADFDLTHELARCTAVAGEDGDAVAVFVVVDQLDGGSDIGSAQYAQYRSKNFFLVDGHLRRDVIEQGAADKEAVFTTRYFETAAVDHQLCTLFYALADQTFDTCFRRSGDDRAHFSIFFHAVVDLQIACAFGQCCDQLVAGVTDCNGNRDRHATFTRRTVGCTDQCVDRDLHICVRHDDHVILGAAQCLYAFALGAAACINVFGKRRRADEADGFDFRMIKQCIDSDLVALDHAEHAVR